MRKKSKLMILFTVAVLVICAVAAAAVTSRSVNLSVPDGLTATSLDGFISLEWEHVKGAKSYEVYKKVKGNWAFQSETADTVFEDKSVKDGKTYAYKIRAISKISQSEFSQIKLLYLAEPKISDAENVKAGIKLYWEKQKTAETLEVYRRDLTDDESQAQWVGISEIDGSDTYFVDEDVSNGMTYEYCLEARKGESRSHYGDVPVQVKCSEAVKSVSAVNSPDGVKLTWKEMNGAESYSIERRSDESQTFEEIGTAQDTQYIDSSAVYGKKNSYKVCAVFEGGDKSAYSSSVQINAIDPNKKMVALTFDDGPYGPVTTKILDTAEKYGARVTFFIVGSRVSWYPDCIKRAVKLGCEIGNHTYNHTVLTQVDKKTMNSEVNKTIEAVKDLCGYEVNLVRCPGGSANDTVKKTVKHPLINWSVDSEDWKNRNTDTTLSRIKSAVSDGSIVLCHDLYESTGNAVTKLIPWLIKQGYQIVTVSEMMQAKGVKQVNGQLYYNCK